MLELLERIFHYRTEIQLFRSGNQILIPDFIVFIDLGSLDLAPHDERIIFHLHDVSFKNLPLCQFRMLLIDSVQYFIELLDAVSRHHIVHLPVQFGACGKRFIMVLENSDALESLPLYEFAKLSEVRIGFSRESDDETRADERALEMHPDIGEKLIDVLLIVEPPHPFQDARAVVLEWNIEVRDEFFQFGKPLQMAECKRVGIQIKQSQPEVSLKRVKRFHKFDEP